MKLIVKIFKWLFSRWPVKDVTYKPKPYRDIPPSLRRNYSTRIMTHHERTLYNHYPNLQKWYNYFGGAIPDKLPELNFKPK